jgi:hypothetical protein
MEVFDLQRNLDHRDTIDAIGRNDERVYGREQFLKRDTLNLGVERLNLAMRVLEKNPYQFQRPTAIASLMIAKRAFEHLGHDATVADLDEMLTALRK